MSADPVPHPQQKSDELSPHTPQNNTSADASSRKTPPSDTGKTSAEGRSAKKIFAYIMCLSVGAIGWWLFLSHMLHYKHYPYYIEHFDLYTGNNVVSKWADFSYFTYHTLLFFSTWSLMYGAASLVGLKKLKRFLQKSTVLSFVFLNYCATALLYTAFELAARPVTFGFYANVPLAYHSLGTNLIAHYLYFALALLAFLKVPAERGRPRIALPLALSYLAVYLAAVKIAGEFAYPIRWFPYPVFDLESFTAVIPVPKAAAAVLLAIVYALFFALYAAAFVLLVRAKEKARPRKAHKFSPRRAQNPTFRQEDGEN